MHQAAASSSAVGAANSDVESVAFRDDSVTVGSATGRRKRMRNRSVVDSDGAAEPAESLGLLFERAMANAYSNRTSRQFNAPVLHELSLALTEEGTLADAYDNWKRRDANQGPDCVSEYFEAMTNENSFRGEWSPDLTLCELD